MELWEKKNVHNVAKKKKFDTTIYVISAIQIAKIKNLFTGDALSVDLSIS